MSIHIMSRVWQNSAQGGTPLLLLLSLADYANQDGYCWPAVPTLARKIRKSVRYTQELLAALTDGGEIEVAHERGPHGTNMYRVLGVKPASPGVKPASPGVSQGAEGGEAGRAEGVSPASYKPSLEPSIETPLTTGKSPVGPQAFPLVENDPWEGTPPQELTVPEGGNKARKSTYVERCDQCQVDITQEMDACKACGRPVHWNGSHIADKRYERQAEKKVDMTAADRRADESKLSEPLRFLLACSRSSTVSFKTHFALGEAEALQALVEAYGGQILKDKANEFKANGEQGRGLIKHVLAYLQQYNPNTTKGHSANAIITDNEELGRQNEAWLVAHGRQSKPEEEEEDHAVSPISPDEPSKPYDDMFAWANEK